MGNKTEVVLIKGHIPETDVKEIKKTIESEISSVRLRSARSTENIREIISEAEIILSYPLTLNQIEVAKNLRWIQALNAGIDGHPTKKLEENEVILTTASGVHAEPTAEQVLGYMLCFERKIHKAIRQQSDNNWERYSSGEISGKTVGIIGLGSIGKRIAKYAKFFDMNVLATKRNIDVSNEAVDKLLSPDGLHEVLVESDYVVISCQLTDETKGLIRTEEIESMKPSAVIINIARGEIIDQEELTLALQNNIIGGAALDVFDPEPLPKDSALWDLSNTIITPHVGGTTPEYWSRCIEIFCKNYKHYSNEDYAKMVNRII